MKTTLTTDKIKTSKLRARMRMMREPMKMNEDIEVHDSDKDSEHNSDADIRMAQAMEVDLTDDPHLRLSTPPNRSLISPYQITSTYLQLPIPLLSNVMSSESDNSETPSQSHRSRLVHLYRAGGGSTNTLIHCGSVKGLREGVKPLSLGKGMVRRTLKGKRKIQRES